MRIFCDTNIIVELVEDRAHAREVQSILGSRHHELYISAGSFMTLSYLFERHFKQQGFHRPELTEVCRRALKGILKIFEVADISKHDLEASLDDLRFSDLEDGCQYRAALECGADVLLTLNDKDFRNATQGGVRIMTPMDFMEGRI